MFMKKINFLTFCLAFTSMFWSLLAQTPSEIVEIELQKLTENQQLAVEDISDWTITSQHTSNLSGIHHVYLRQAVNGLEILGTESSVHILSDRSVLQSNTNFVKDVNGNLRATATPSIDAVRAVENAANYLNYAMTEPLEVIEEKSSLNQEVLLSDAGISRRPIPAKLSFYRTKEDTVILVWDLSIESVTDVDWFNVRVNAVTGEVVDTLNWTVNCNLSDSDNHDHLHMTPEMDTHTKHAHSNVEEEEAMLLTGSYRVFAMPIESPYYGSRTLETNVVNTNASPFGWHDTNGVAGPEFTVTRGNNVNAIKPSNSFQPDGGASLLFDYPYNPVWTTGNTSEAAAITNLFYWNNIIHDVVYQYGFDEVSGNFQVNNYGNGGLGNDSVTANAQLGTVCNAFFGTPPDGSSPSMSMYVCGTQDGCYDNLVIVHEYAHGITNRLTGGAATTGCLSNQEQMGEGWSDWYGLILTMTAADAAVDARGVGTYLFNQGAGGPGIRSFPYSTDMTVNPQTYNHIITESVPHGVGSVWATMLWEMTWGLIDAYGFDSDFYNGSGGNNIAMALVTEALKLQPCSPGFVDGRDAILAADVALYSGANQCIIWNAFAKRGLGFSADQGSSASRSDGVEAFDTPFQPDIYIRDTPSDDGTEPSAGIMWTSPDIWVRHDDDNGLIHQNPEYKTNSPNWVYIRVNEKNCSDINDATLKLYFSKASTGLSWPLHWDNYYENVGGSPVLHGDFVGSTPIPSTINGETIVKIPWYPPNPADYVNDVHHYCLLARIESTIDPIGTEIASVNLNTMNNNNIAWKNVSVYDLDPNNFTGVSVFIRNLDEANKPIRLRLRVTENQTGIPFEEVGRFFIIADNHLNDLLLSAELDGIENMGNGRFRITKNEAVISNIRARYLETLSLNLLIMPLVNLDEEKYLIYDLIQTDSEDRIVGGEQFYVHNSRKKNQNTASNEPNSIVVLAYPNPTKDKVSITIDKKYEQVTYELRNIFGELVTTNTLKDSDSFDVTLDKFIGVYFLKIIVDGNITETIKLIKE